MTGFAEAANEPYEVVSAEDKLGDTAPTGWVLVEHGSKPLAFLSPEAAAAALGSQPLQYLANLRAGYTADLSNPAQLFHHNLEFNNPGRPVVVFDGNQLRQYGIVVPRVLDLNSQPCENGYHPRPPATCPDCICTAAEIQS